MNKLLYLILLNKLKNKSGGTTPSEYNAKISAENLTTFTVTYGIKKIGDLDFTGITSTSQSFMNCGNLSKIGEIKNTNSVVNMGGMFSGCVSLTHLTTSTFSSNFTTEAVKNGFTFMFQYCSSLIDVDLTNFNTKKVTHMTRMFEGCSNLETIIFGSDFSFEKCVSTGMQQMFNSCTKLNNTTLNSILGLLPTFAQSSNKTLQYIGLSSDQATICQGLSNWAAAQSAGWTTGY